MALDAATLALVAAQLKATLAGARIDKLHQPTRDEVLLLMRSRNGSARLLLSARSGSARVCLTDEAYENPATPPSFCMLLRKHLTGGRLDDVRCPPGERIVFFDFMCSNELGEPIPKTLAAELMGRYCNLVLVAGFPPLEMAEGDAPLKIIDALKRVDFEASDIRQLLPGLPYTLPPKPDRPDFLTVSRAGFGAVLAATGQPPADAVRKTLGGVGPVVLREVVHRAFGPAGKPADATPNSEAVDALWQQVEAIRADWAAGGAPNLVRKPDGAPAEFSFTPLTQYQPECALESYPNFSVLLEAYYAQKDRAERLRQRSKALRKTVQNLYDRAVRKQAARRQELADSEQSDHLRIAGELLTANLHAIEKGAKEVRVHNWYDDTEVALKLDPRLSPSANAQRYFKDYKKKQTAITMLAQLLEAGEREIVYLETVLYEVEQAHLEAELDEIRAELKSQGYLKYFKPRQKKQKAADVLRYRSSDGFAILVGRNNAQNEKLTLKTARGRDLWFHVKNAPGSHVVVMSEGADIPLATQNEAAMLAVWHSSQRQGVKVPVDYTEVKNIRKTGNLPPGMVLYDHYETAAVTPDAVVIQGLEAQQGK